MRALHKNPHSNTILNSHLVTLKAYITKNRKLLTSAVIFEASSKNSVGPDQTAPVEAV